MIGETTVLQARTEFRGSAFAPVPKVRAEFRSGTPGRRAQDARAQDAAARLRAPIFDLRATNRQALPDPQTFDTGRAPKPSSILRAGAVYRAPTPPVETISAAGGLRALVPAGYDERNPLRRLSVNDAYLSAEMLDGPYARRGSVFDLRI